MTVILTMTTIPNRLSEDRDGWGLRKNLDILLNMSYDDYVLHLNIPETHKKTHEKYVLPEWLNNLNHPKLKLFYRCEDYGPLTKIVPTLHRTWDDAVIITVDDDLEYMDGFIEYHLKKREQYPDAVLGFSGLCTLDNTMHFCTTVKEDVRVKILEGYKTVSYKRSMFKDDFFTDFVGKHWNDDITISAYMGKHNVPKIVLAYDCEIDYTPRVESFPVVGHLPVEWGGCNIYRQENNSIYHEIENEYYRLQYLER